MPNIEYRNREQVASESADPEGYLPVDLGVIISAIGDRALFDDLVLTPGTIPKKEHGPRSAIYSALNLSSGILLSVARFHEAGQDEAMILEDRARLAEAIEESAKGHQILDRSTFGLIHSISVTGAFPGYRRPLPSASVELRIAPEGNEYITMAVPTYMRTAPEFVARYLQGMKRIGRSDYDPVLEDVAYQNDNRNVARMLATNVMYHILKDYEEHDKLEAEFASD